MIRFLMLSDGGGIEANIEEETFVCSCQLSRVIQWPSFRNARSQGQCPSLPHLPQVLVDKWFFTWVQSNPRGSVSQFQGFGGLVHPARLCTNTVYSYIHAF